MSWGWAFAFISLGALAGLVSLALVTTKRLPREEDDDVTPERFPAWEETRVEFAPTSCTTNSHGTATVEKRRARKAQRKARRKQRGR